MIKLIQRDVDYTRIPNGLSIEGTHAEEKGDLVADLFNILPFPTRYGFVGLGPHIQGKKIYKENKEFLHSLSHIILKGHSLGGANLVNVVLELRKHGYKGTITAVVMGGLKTLGIIPSLILKYSKKVNIVWVQDKKDPVSTLLSLPWVMTPTKKDHTIKTAEKKTFWPILDFDLVEGVHMSYWEPEVLEKVSNKLTELGLDKT